jgi:Flp pilus assembly pilin Flp
MYNNYSRAEDSLLTVLLESLIEYGLLLALIAGLVLLLMAPLSVHIHHVFQTIETALGQAAGVPH